MPPTADITYRVMILQVPRMAVHDGEVAFTHRFSVNICQGGKWRQPMGAKIQSCHTLWTS